MRYALGFGAGLLAVALGLILWAKTPPAVARLLPECDAIVYINVKPLRAATHFDRTSTPRSLEFQHFIDVTGIVPERDLDSVAFALHRMNDPSGPNGPVAYSEVFKGRFDLARLERYLATETTARESYAGHAIYTLPTGEATGSGQRRLRVVQLGANLVAASNTPSTEQIHGIIDRHRSLTSPFAGSSLLNGLYSEVPWFASAWAIGQAGLPFAERGYVTLFGLQLPLRETSTFVASLRYLGTVDLRVEEIATTEAEAADTAQQLSSVLALFRSIERAGGSQVDATIREGLESIRIVPKGTRLVVTANLPLALLRHLAEPTPQAPPVTPPASH